MSLTPFQTYKPTDYPICSDDSDEFQGEELLGQEVRVFEDEFAPEAIGTIEKVRGFGTLQVVEVRIHPNQPRPRLRIAACGKWELIGGES
jgi:hypothetical protein